MGVDLEDGLFIDSVGGVIACKTEMHGHSRLVCSKLDPPFPANQRGDNSECHAFAQVGAADIKRADAEGPSTFLLDSLDRKHQVCLDAAKEERVWERGRQAPQESSS